MLRPALSRVRGVGRIEVLGGDVREVEVVLDPERTAALHLRPTDVAERLRASTVLEAVGRLEESHEQVTVMASAEPRSLADIERVPVATAADGSPVPLSAIARVFEGAEDRLLRVNGPGGETVLLSVSRLPGASTPDVVGEVERTVHALAPSLPAGVRVEPVYDQAELVAESMASVRDAILIGIALCVLVIGLFLRNLRAGVIAALVVPLTLAMSLLAAALAGQSLNLMSLGGLAVAIGLVIDDAIVVVEAIGRRMQEGEPAAAAALSGPRLLLAALLGTTATTVVVLDPARAARGRGRPVLRGARGHAGRGGRAVAGGVADAGAAARAALAGRGAAPAQPARGSPPATRACCAPACAIPPGSRSARARCCSPGAIALGAVPSGFLPTMDEGAFVLDYFLPAGTSLGETDAVARKIEAELRRTPEVATYSRRTGAELGPATATLVSRGDIMVRLKPARERTRDAEEVIAAVRAAVARDVPEARTEFVQVLQDVLNDLAGTPRPIEIKIFGDDYATLRRQAADVVARIRDVRGLVDLYPGFEDESPELQFRIDAAQAARLGRTAADIAADLETTLRGTVAAVFRRPDRPIDVRVRYPDDVRFDPARVAALPLAWSPAGVTPVTAAAPAQHVAISTQLTRENLRPVVIVTADHEDRDLGSVVRDVQRRLAGLTLPEGYRIELGGQFEGQQRTFHDVGLVLAFGLLAVRGGADGAVPARAPRGAGAGDGAARDRRRAAHAAGDRRAAQRIVADGLRAAGRPGGEERDPAARAVRAHAGRRAAARRRAAVSRLDARAADPDDHHRDARRPGAARAGHGCGRGDPAPAGDRGDRRFERLDRDQPAGFAGAGSSQLVVSRRRGAALNIRRPSADAMCAQRAPMDISPSKQADGNLLARGATIGRFQVIALVGKGGMGEVYAAYDPELDRNVAIKLLRAGKNSDSDEGRARMMREAQATARVSHPNVVIVYDAGTFQERVFIAMEFVEGHTLGYWMHARTRSWPEVLEVFTAAGRGLAAAHERDLVHRDFKPDNVMIGADGQVRVMDFGLVQIAGERTADALIDADDDTDGNGRVEAVQDDVTAEHSAGNRGSGPTSDDAVERRSPTTCSPRAR